MIERKQYEKLLNCIVLKTDDDCDSAKGYCSYEIELHFDDGTVEVISGCHDNTPDLDGVEMMGKDRLDK